MNRNFADVRGRKIFDRGKRRAIQVVGDERSKFPSGERKGNSGPGRWSR